MTDCMPLCMPIAYGAGILNNGLSSGGTRQGLGHSVSDGGAGRCFEVEDLQSLPVCS